MELHQDFTVRHQCHEDNSYSRSRAIQSREGGGIASIGVSSPSSSWNRRVDGNGGSEFSKSTGREVAESLREISSIDSRTWSLISTSISSLSAAVADPRTHSVTRLVFSGISSKRFSILSLTQAAMPRAVLFLISAKIARAIAVNEARHVIPSMT